MSNKINPPEPLESTPPSIHFLKSNAEASPAFLLLHRSTTVMTHVALLEPLRMSSRVVGHVRWLHLAGVLVVSMLMSSTMSLAQGPAAAEKRPTVDSKITDFDLPIVGSADTLKLSETYLEGPVVVVVLRGYPGYQCPICSRQVGAIINQAKAFNEVASKVILVYPGPRNLLEQRATEFIAGRDLPDPIVMVRDEDMEMVKSWGLRWDEPQETAYPSTFVVDKTGKVTWAKISDGHADRSSVDDVIRALKN